jgi:hypothetical protein
MWSCVPIVILALSRSRETNLPSLTTPQNAGFKPSREIGPKIRR